jgi:hypothetical protein
MDNGCFILDWNRDFLFIKPGPVAERPVVDVAGVKIYDSGDLPKGIYFYAVTSVGVNGESLPHMFQVYLSHEENSVVFSWEIIPHITEYRVYRGQHTGRMDGFYTMYTQDGYFHDNGLGVLNIAKFNPPDFVSPPMSVRKIHRDMVKCFRHLYSESPVRDQANVSELYVVLHSGEVIALDMYKMIEPQYTEYKNQQLKLLLRNLENWKHGIE